MFFFKDDFKGFKDFNQGKEIKAGSRFFEDFRIYFGLWPLSVSLRCQCVYTLAGQTQALAAELAELKKSQHFKEKHNI